MLSKNEKELLAVVKYYTSQKRAIARLLVKLGNSFDDDTVSAMTGLTSTEINSFVFSLPVHKLKHPKPNAFTKARMGALGPSRKTKKLQEEMRADALALDTETAPTEPLFDTLTIYGRLANELYAEINKAYSSGETFLSSREIVEKFNVGRASAERALKLLLEKGILVKNETPRQPHVVK